MMTPAELSKHRQTLSQLIDKIDKLAFQCAYADGLIQGTPGEVFRTCGKKNCRCITDPSLRHGPYPVIQIYQDKKQRQVSIKQEHKEYWQKAKNYQKQMNTLTQLKETCEQLTEMVQKILNQRLEELP